MKKAFKVIVIILCVLVVLVGGIILFGKTMADKAKKDTINSAEKYTVTKGDLQLTAVGSGKIVSADVKKVVLNGNISEILVSIGDQVKKGDILAKYKDSAGKEQDFKADYEGVITAVPSGVSEQTNSGNSAAAIAGMGVTATASSSFEISSNSKLQMDIQATEKDIYKIKVSQKATIYIDALDLTVAGEVSRVSLTGNTSGDFSVYAVTVSFDKTNDKIFLGMTGSAKIIIDTRKDVIKVPVDALIEKDGKLYVLTSDWFDNFNQPQNDFYIEIKTGNSDSDYVEVTSGDINGKEILILSDDSSKGFPMPNRNGDAQ